MVESSLAIFKAERVWSTPPLESLMAIPSGSGSPASSPAKPDDSVFNIAAAFANNAVWSASASVHTAIAESPAGATNRAPSTRERDEARGRSCPIPLANDSIALRWF